MALIRANEDTLNRFSVEGIPFKRKVSRAAGDLIRLAADLSVPGYQKEEEAVEALVDIIFSVKSEDEIKQWVDDVLAFDGWLEFLTDRIIGVTPLRWGAEKAACIVIRWTYESMVNSGAAI